MNWGYKILVVIIIFIAGMGTMVTIAMKQKNEMEDDQYYVKELKHQNLIDAEKNLNKLGEKLSILDTNNLLRLTIPHSTITNISNGKIDFLRPSDQTKDLTIAMSMDDQGEQFISKKNLVRGLYNIKVSWQSQGVAYYTERSIFIN
jgi:hypothetical protein